MQLLDQVEKNQRLVLTRFCRTCCTSWSSTCRRQKRWMKPELFLRPHRDRTNIEEINQRRVKNMWVFSWILNLSRRTGLGMRGARREALISRKLLVIESDVWAACAYRIPATCPTFEGPTVLPSQLIHSWSDTPAAMYDGYMSFRSISFLYLAPQTISYQRQRTIILQAEADCCC